METATFGAGCFWGVESFFREVPGVADAVCGYAGGTVDNPTYRQVCADTTGHAEVVQVDYDPAKVGYDRLLDVCDWNFVRGEDSLVRAIWAERPLVWHLYPQAELAHAPKLDAFLDWWLTTTPAEIGRAHV